MRLVRQFGTFDEARFIRLLFFVFLCIVNAASSEMCKSIAYFPQGHDTLRSKTVMQHFVYKVLHSLLPRRKTRQPEGDAYD